MPPTTVGDLVTAYQTDQQTLSTDANTISSLKSQLDAATAKQTTDQATLVKDTHDLGAALVVTGGVFVQNSDGSITAFEPDGSGGVAAKALKPAGATPVPTPAAPPA